MWHLPWAELHYPNELQAILDDFDWDMVKAPAVYKEAPKTTGDPYKLGEYIDEWGCKFTNVHEGYFGESKEPLVTDDGWGDADKVHIPDEFLTFDTDVVNRFCEQSDKFVMATSAVRPFEQLQFIRGVADLYMDLMDMPPRMTAFLSRMHEHYCQVLEKWAKTDVDSIGFLDDWGSQTSLLISPELWAQIFKPMYRDYINIAKSHNKKVFMHSDGNILGLFPHLIELGLDAINAQIFCMRFEELEEFKGSITFWGEIDRQHLLPKGTLEDIDKAVDLVYDTLWDNGGCIAQCEFGPMANPENVRRIFERWNDKI